jgi:hypothetical protein
MWLAAVAPQVVFAAVVVFVICFLVLVLLVAFSSRASRRITRLLVNLCAVIYAVRSQTPQSTYHPSPQQRSGGRRRTTP